MHKKCKVIWFNNLKGYGQAETEAGEKIYIHYSAIKKRESFVRLDKEQHIACLLGKNSTNDLIAETIVI